MKFPLQTVYYDLRQIIPIHFMGSVIADLCQRLIGIRDDRRTFIRPHRSDLFTHL